jgi:hypothetical protein
MLIQLIIVNVMISGRNKSNIISMIWIKYLDNVMIILWNRVANNKYKYTHLGNLLISSLEICEERSMIVNKSNKWSVYVICVLFMFIISG